MSVREERADGKQPPGRAMNSLVDASDAEERVKPAEERAEEFGARNGVPGELLVRMAIDKVLAEKAVSG